MHAGAVDDGVRLLDCVAGGDRLPEGTDRVRHISVRHEDLVDPPEVAVSGLARYRVDNVPLPRDRSARRSGLEEWEDGNGDDRLKTSVHVGYSRVAYAASYQRDQAMG